MQERILIIDTDVELITTLSDLLTRQGYGVLVAQNGREGLKVAYREHPVLVVLDVLLPEMDGWQVCERLREISDIPIIIVTTLAEERDVVKGFQLGADDYIRKPFVLAELEARIRAVRRRVAASAPGEGHVYDDGTLRIDLDQQQAWRRGEAVHLTPTEFRLLSGLIKRKGRVVPHEELLTEVWGPAYHDATNCLSLYIRYVREKLEDNPCKPKYIKTKWGTGYLFAPNGLAA